jgi:hypothetical protein
MATAAWHWRSTTKDNWTLSHSASTGQASLARWQERLQGVKLPSQNKVSAPDSPYDVERALNQDLS